MTKRIIEKKYIKTLILVRHGEDLKNPERLTQLGRKQARLTANYLKHLSDSQLFSSSAKRSKWSMEYIEKALKKKAKYLKLFESLLPAPNWLYKHDFDFKSMNKRDREQLRQFIKQSEDRAVRAFELLAQLPKKENESFIIMAHGNIIRFWVCCALKISNKKWIQMRSPHCSITKIEIHTDGTRLLTEFASVGHLPIGLSSDT